jgi:hypothetical protein
MSMRFLRSMLNWGAGPEPADTPASDRPRFLWSDAWFLAALAASDGGPVPLTRVIAMGDAIEHAIFERAEVNGALGRLGRSGYVTRHADGTLEMTEAGRSLVGGAKGRRMAEWMDQVERLLGAAPWSPAHAPRRAAEGEAEQVSEAEYDAAIDGYRSGRIT